MPKIPETLTHDKHNPATCQHCETVPPDQYRRLWKAEEKRRCWHVIADGPDLMGRLPRQAHFVTILSYRPGLDGSPAHYHGPLYCEFDASDPSQAFEELRRCLILLMTEYECPAESIHIWHSGGRGAHVTIPPVVCGAEEGDSQLPRLYAAMIQQLFPSSLMPTLDRSVYSMGKGRQWRLPNRRRADTGRHKAPLTVREALYTPYADLEVLTRRPRKGVFWPPEDELSPCPALVQLYQECLAAVETTTARPPQVAGEGARIPEGQRNATLTSLAGAMRRRGASLEAIEAALAAENQRCDPPLPDAEIQGIAASIGRYPPPPAR